MNSSAAKLLKQSFQLVGKDWEWAYDAVLSWATLGVLAEMHSAPPIFYGQALRSWVLGEGCGFGDCRL